MEKSQINATNAILSAVIRVLWGRDFGIFNIFWFIKSINAQQNMYSIRKKFPANTNTNTIRFEKITRIRIRIIFGFKKSPEYEYEYQYSASSIRIIFEYRIIRSPLALKPVKAHYCAQRQNIKEYKRTIYFQKVQTGCIFYWSPPNTFQVLWSGW